MMNPFTLFAASCHNAGLLGFPSWYEFLPGTTVNGLCSPSLTSLSDIWLVVAAIIDILLRIATLVAVGFVIVGAVKYITSQGAPDQLAQARQTIINALVGLVLAVAAALVVQFIAGRF